MDCSNDQFVNFANISHSSKDRYFIIAQCSEENLSNTTNSTGSHSSEQTMRRPVLHLHKA